MSWPFSQNSPFNLPSCINNLANFSVLKMIAKYLENTHATTHNQYHMELLDVFALEHEKKGFTDVGNKWVFIYIFLFFEGLMENILWLEDLQCRTKLVGTLIKRSLKWYKRAFCTAFLVQKRLPILLGYLLYPLPPKQSWKQFWVHGMVNFQHCLGGGGLKVNFMKNCVKCPNTYDPHCS